MNKNLHSALDNVEALKAEGRLLKFHDFDRCDPRAEFPVVTSPDLPEDTVLMIDWQRDDRGNIRPVIIGKITNIGG